MSKKEDSKRRPATGPRIALAQIAPTLGDAEANLEQHRNAVEQAVAEGADLLVFPELSLAGYRLKDSVPDVAIKRDSDTWKELETLSEKVSLVVGLVEESPDHLFYNSAAYFEGGKCLAVHRKTYLPTYGMFDEQRYFARGRGVAAFDTKWGRVAMLVCEDMLHPSAVTIAACDGATLLVVPSASPARGVTTEGEADANARSWESYVQVMARSFGVWVAYCNRVGVEDGVTFWGGSEVVAPGGETVAKADYYDEDLVSAVVSDDAVRRRRIVNPLVRDEDLDLTINELSRIRGRAVAEAATEEKASAPRERKSEGGSAARPFDKAARRSDGDAPPRAFDRDAPPRAFDRDAPPRRFDGGAPPRRFDGGAPPRRDAPPRPFDRDNRGPRGGEGGGFRPRPPYQERGGADRPRFGGPGGDRNDGPRGGFGGQSRGRDDRQGGGFGGPRRDRDDGPPRGGFGGGPRGREDGPRGGFGGQTRGRDDRQGGGFGGPARDRNDGPRGGGGGFGPPRGPAGGFGPPRPGFGAAPRDREGGGFGGKSSFGESAPRSRDRQRPEPARKPFHKGSKPRGRKDD